MEFDDLFGHEPLRPEVIGLTVDTSDSANNLKSQMVEKGWKLVGLLNIDQEEPMVWLFRRPTAAGSNTHPSAK